MRRNNAWFERDVEENSLGVKFQVQGAKKNLYTGSNAFFHLKAFEHAFALDENTFAVTTRISHKDSSSGKNRSFCLDSGNSGNVWEKTREKSAFFEASNRENREF
jgi:hypothetical protein